MTSIFEGFFIGFPNKETIVYLFAKIGSASICWIFKIVLESRSSHDGFL